MPKLISASRNMAGTDPLSLRGSRRSRDDLPLLLLLLLDSLLLLSLLFVLGTLVAHGVPPLLIEPKSDRISQVV